MKRMTDEAVRTCRSNVADNQHECDCGLLHESGCFEGECEESARLLAEDHDRARAREARLEAALAETERVLKAWHKDKGEWAALRRTITGALESE